jgi:nucleoside-diphosphate-sugar epimerase
VVFGATGAIGSAVVTELVHAGRDVRAVSRSGQAPDGAQGVAADAADPAQAARAAAGASVIYHCASPPYTRWPELFPALTSSILSAAESSGAKLVFADNLYAYGPVNGPLREDLPAAARGRKGRIRVEMAAQLLAAHRNGRVRVVIGRASDYYGPHGTGSTAGQTVFGRILAGKKPQWPGRLDQPHTFHYLSDIARGLLVLADRPEADGQVWHLPAAPPLTAQQFFDMIAEAAGQPVPVHASIASPALLAVAGIFSPLLREMRETTYQFRAPFVIDASKFEAALGHLEPTPHRDAVPPTVAWYRSR